MAEKIAELEKKLETHEKRIKQLEKLMAPQQAKKEKEPNFKGLTGGINFIISQQYLNNPKSVKEIVEKLKLEGYHYGEKSAEKILRVNLMQKRKILTRVREDDIWKYVIRK